MEHRLAADPGWNKMRDALTVTERPRTRSRRAVSAGWLAGAVFLGSCSLGACAGAATADEFGFVVHGTVRHQQFGPQPYQKQFKFHARSAGCAWTMSCADAAGPPDREIKAVGNEQGVFLVFDLKEAVAQARSKGQPVPKNTAEAMVLRNSVPNSTLAPQVAPVWFAFLSGCFLEHADPLRMPLPVALNVVGGSSPPPFVEHYQRCTLTRDERTGLPVAFAALDEDGYLRGYLRGQVVRAERYPPPFDTGFTNVTYQVAEHTEFMGYRLPKRATLEVYWIAIPAYRLERIHTFEIEADRFETAPPAPPPQPTLSGVTLVADARLWISNSPVIVPYSASNRFFGVDELERLPEFKRAVSASIGAQAAAENLRSGGRRARLVVLFALAASTTILVAWAARTRKRRASKGPTT